MPTRAAKAQSKKPLDPVDTNAKGSGQVTTMTAHESPPANGDVDPSTKAKKLNDLAGDSFAAQRYKEAIDLYTEALALRPTEPTYLTNRAASHIALKDFRNALADCQLAVRQASPPSVDALVCLARCQLALGSPTAALSAVRDALSADAAHVPAQELQRNALRMEQLLTRVKAARKQGDWSAVRIALDEAATLCEGAEPLQWRCWRTELELASGKLDQASSIIDSAYEIDRMNPDVLCLRGLIMFLRGNLPAAKDHLEISLKYDQENKRAIATLRRVRNVIRLKKESHDFFNAGKFGSAVDLYSEARDVVDKNVEEAGGGVIRATLLSDRAAALLKLDWHEDALSDVNESLELVGTSHEALRTRAQIYMKLAKYQEAVGDYKAALQQVQDQDERLSLKQELRAAENALNRVVNYYEILELPRDCTEQDIKRAFRKKSLVLHPDRGGDAEKFDLARKACLILLDRHTRAQHDDQLEGRGNEISEEDLDHLAAEFGLDSEARGFSFGSFDSSHLFGGQDSHAHHNPAKASTL